MPRGATNLQYSLAASPGAHYYNAANRATRVPHGSSTKAKAKHQTVTLSEISALDTSPSTPRRIDHGLALVPSEKVTMFVSSLWSTPSSYTTVHVVWNPKRRGGVKPSMDCALRCGWARLSDLRMVAEAGCVKWWVDEFSVWAPVAIWGVVSAGDADGMCLLPGA